jgi:hypothetical protein
MFKEISAQLVDLRALAVWRSDDLPMFYRSAEDCLTSLEERARCIER